MSGDITKLQINLISKNIPPPESLRVIHNSELQIITLSWNRPLRRNGLRFNIFRRIEGGADTLLTHEPISDTFYMDDVVSFIYSNAQYSVSAIDSHIIQSDRIYSEPILIRSPWTRRRTGTAGENDTPDNNINGVIGGSGDCLNGQYIEGEFLKDDSVIFMINKTLSGFTTEDFRRNLSFGSEKNMVRMKYGIFIVNLNEGRNGDNAERFWRIVCFFDDLKKIFYRITETEGDIVFLECRPGFAVIKDYGITETYALVK